jgi:hypothetical protein
MRACFLGQSVTALGFGVATLQTPPLVADEATGKPLEDHADSRSEAVGQNAVRHALMLAPRTGIGSL